MSFRESDLHLNSINIYWCYQKAATHTGDKTTFMFSFNKEKSDQIKANKQTCDVSL
jgi:hypothetical protein